MNRTVPLLGITFVGLALCACVQGQDYQRPSIETPDSWSRVTHVPAAVSTDRRPEAAWWKTFQNNELTALIEQALDHNHDVKRAIARIVEGRASILSATAGLFPQLNLSGSYTNIAVSKNTLAGLGLATGQRPGPQIFATPGTTFDLWNGALDLRWEIDFWGRIRRGREAAQAETKAIEEDARAVALSLISDVGQSYFRIRELDEQLDIAMRTLAVRQESLEIIQKRATVGLASELDVKRTEVLVAEAAGLVPELTRLRAMEIHRLEVLIGMPPGSLNLASKPLRAVVMQPDIPVGLPSQLLERRPDILQAESMLMASNARIGQARAHFFPALTITGQGGLQSADFAKWFTGNSFNYSIGPSITLPIFQGGTNLARLDHAESRYQQMLESYRQTILQAFREVADLLTSLNARGDQLRHQREQLAAAQAAMQLAHVRYRKGMVNYLDVLDAQRTVLVVETQLVLTERTRLAEMVSLFKALGGGWEPGAVKASS
ncbi:MAG: efflux transporter outer membrane subunit [Nitrospira sp.]|nr:efflux transporter outer membrane subunit [Nitrospira sp.]